MDVHVAADVVALSLGLEDDVVFLAIQVLASEEPCGVVPLVAVVTLRGVFTVPVCVEPAEALLQLLVLLVVDVVVEGLAVPCIPGSRL